MSQEMVDAVLVTYQRPDALLASCRALAEQTTSVRTLVIVNNGDPAGYSEEHVLGLTWGSTEVVFRPPAENLGPAGGFQHGIDWLVARHGDNGWLLLLDDDDPLPAPGVLAGLRDEARQLEQSGHRLGGVALQGARFDRRRLRTRAVDPGEGGTVPVDHLHGGHAPLYQARALSEAGGFRAELFWGFEELDLGLRIVKAGWSLFMAVELLHSFPLSPKVTGRTGRPSFRVSPGPQGYYKLRNLIDIGRRHGAGTAVWRAILVRAYLKPLANVVVAPRRACQAIVMNHRAARDGLRGRLGRRFTW